MKKKEEVNVEIHVSYQTSEKSKEGPRRTVCGMCRVSMDAPKDGEGPVTIRFHGSQQDKLFLDSFMTPVIESIRNGDARPGG